MIQLQALGSPEIRTPVVTITPSQEIVFAAALYLTLESQRPVSRTSLAGLLWPDVILGVRSHRLRQTLLQLKRMGLEIEATRDTVHIALASCAIDTDGEIPCRDGPVIWPPRIEVLAG